MIRLSWSVRRQSGRPLLPVDIERYELAVTRDGAAVETPHPGQADTGYTFNATEPGLYGFALVCVPKRGGASGPVSGSVELFDETQVEVFNFTIEVVAP